ncbi:MAG: nuclear transport factor 2 family protein [Pseudomonadota bacterium]
MANEEALAALLDREAIRELPVRYCDHVWRNDVDGLIELFADDGEFIIRTSEGDTAVAGREALVELYADGLADAPRPYIHNHVVDLTSDSTASGRCYLDLRSAKHNMDWLGAGFYQDDYIKRNQSWLFQRRLFTVLRIDEWPGSVERPSR